MYNSGSSSFYATTSFFKCDGCGAKEIAPDHHEISWEKIGDKFFCGPCMSVFSVFPAGPIELTPEDIAVTNPCGETNRWEDQLPEPEPSYAEQSLDIWLKRNKRDTWF